MATKQWASQLHYKHTDHMKVNNTPTMRRNEKKKYQMKIRNINLANAQNTNEHRNKSKSTLQPEKIQSHINRGVALQIPQLSQCCCSGESEGRKEGNRGNAQTREEVSRADKCVHKTRSLSPVKLIPTSLFVTSSLVHFSFSKKKIWTEVEEERGAQTGRRMMRHLARGREEGRRRGRRGKEEGEGRDTKGG